MKNGSFLQVSPQVWLRGEKLDKHLKKKKVAKMKKKIFKKILSFVLLDYHVVLLTKVLIVTWTPDMLLFLNNTFIFFAQNTKIGLC